MSASAADTRPTMASRPLALVTGAAHRLGRVFALTLARRGYAVVVHYHRAAEAARETVAAIRALGVPAYPLAADLTRPEAIAALFQQLDALPHPLTVLVNSAAVMPRQSLDELDAAAWDAVFDLNLRAPYLCAREAARRMPTGGVIVNVSDAGAVKAWTQYPAYIVSKAALEHLTRVLARLLAPRIRVNAIAPGLALPGADLPADTWERLVARVPLRRPADSEELAHALLFVLDNAYLTGQVLRVDGGFSLV